MLSSHTAASKDSPSSDERMPVLYPVRRMNPRHCPTMQGGDSMDPAASHAADVSPRGCGVWGRLRIKADLMARVTGQHQVREVRIPCGVLE